MWAFKNICIDDLSPRSHRVGMLLEFPWKSLSFGVGFSSPWKSLNSGKTGRSPWKVLEKCHTMENFSCTKPKIKWKKNPFIIFKKSAIVRRGFVSSYAFGAFGASAPWLEMAYPADIRDAIWLALSCVVSAISPIRKRDAFWPNVWFSVMASMSRKVFDQSEATENFRKKEGGGVYTCFGAQNSKMGAQTTKYFGKVLLMLGFLIEIMSEHQTSCVGTWLLFNTYPFWWLPKRQKKRKILLYLLF